MISPVLSLRVEFLMGTTVELLRKAEANIELILNFFFIIFS